MKERLQHDIYTCSEMVTPSGIIKPEKEKFKKNNENINYYNIINICISYK